MFPIASVRFAILYGLLCLSLLLALLAAFALHGILSWTAGLIYILYDSFIQCLVVSMSARNLEDKIDLPEPEKSVSRLPTVTAVIPARNEKSVLESCLNALSVQTHAPDEIIVVDDGSSDGTLEWLTDRFRLQCSGDIARSTAQPNLQVIRKSHSGKAGSLNAGWRKSGCEIVVTIDADTVLDRNAIMAMCRAFADDPELAAAGGILEPRCADTFPGRIFQFYQSYEYIRSFLERYAWMRFGTLVLVSGAFSAFRRDTLQKLEGFDQNSTVEDYELIYRYYRYCGAHSMKPVVKIVGQARAVTDAPSSMRMFLLQRSRWFAGFIETLFRNQDMVADPRFGRFGKFMLPLKLVDTLRPLYGLLALAIFLGYWAAGFRPYVIIIYVQAAKLLFDLAFHCRAFILFHKWQARAISAKEWRLSMIAILTEPFAFQILRHLAATLGIIAYINGRMAWAQQRQISKAPDNPHRLETVTSKEAYH